VKRYVVAGVAMLLALAPAAAEYKPTRPVEFVVHNGPGSGNDVFARALIQVIEKEKLMPVRMQVANKVGGGSTTAAAYVTEKAGDANLIAVFTNIWLTDTLVQADLWGHQSHGVLRLGWYLDRIRHGVMHPVTTPEFVVDAGWLKTT